MNEINDVAKQRIVDKLFEAIDKENLTQSEAAKLIGTDASYISSMKKKIWWKLCPIKAWNLSLAWVNSGQGLKEYAEKHGKVLAQPTKVEASNTPPWEEDSVPISPESVSHSEKSVPEKKISEPRMSRGTLIDLLLEEKELLKCKIAAIDVLLTHYISQ